MGYDKETSKEYNKKYYEQKKLEKGLKKVECCHCKRMVCSNALKNHQKTPLCQLTKLQLQQLN
jgi:hypothetical protein